LNRWRWLLIAATAASLAEKTLALLGNHLDAMPASKGAGTVARPARKMRLDSGKAMLRPELPEDFQCITITQFPTS
jgi:hypothetical protein